MQPIAGNLANFFRDYLGLSGYIPTEAAHVSQLIYRIRNSIVHNKESEFHFTTTNPDDYRIIIPIVNTLIAKLEAAVFEKISTNPAIIKYGSRAIQLY